MTNISSQPSTNEERAANADDAITEFLVRKHGSDWQEPHTEEDVVDLMADLLHYAHREDFDVLRILRLAQLHYECEGDVPCS